MTAKCQREGCHRKMDGEFCSWCRWTPGDSVMPLQAQQLLSRIADLERKTADAETWARSVEQRMTRVSDEGAGLQSLERVRALPVGSQVLGRFRGDVYVKEDDNRWVNVATGSVWEDISMVGDTVYRVGRWPDQQTTTVPPAPSERLADCGVMRDDCGCPNGTCRLKPTQTEEQRLKDAVVEAALVWWERPIDMLRTLEIAVEALRAHRAKKGGGG